MSSGEALLWNTAALVAFGLLVTAGLSHVVNLSSFRRQIHKQAVWPRKLEPALVTLVTSAEGGIGSAGMAMLIGGSPAVRFPAAAATVLYSSYTVYLTYLLRYRPSVPCACSGSEEPVNVATALRALSLAALGSITYLEANAAANVTSRAAVLLGALAPSVVIAIAIWSLPPALNDPLSVAAGPADGTAT